MSSISRKALAAYLSDLLEVNQFHDYCPNGLQVEGRDEISRIVTGVTASQALIEAAIENKADAVLVHHGYFWRNENPVIAKSKMQRLRLLLSHDINLFAYHLPLDAHPIYGNNVQLAKVLGIEKTVQTGEQGIMYHGCLPDPMPLQALGDNIAEKLARVPLIIGDMTKPVQRISWCTGGAQGYFHDVAETGETDVYITGEASEFVTHLARESGTAFIAAGHHATERYGIMSLGEHLQQQFSLTHTHIEISNPV